MPVIPNVVACVGTDILGGNLLIGELFMSGSYLQLVENVSQPAEHAVYKAASLKWHSIRIGNTE